MLFGSCLYVYVYAVIVRLTLTTCECREAHALSILVTEKYTLKAKHGYVDSYSSWRLINLPLASL